ncbi:MULTISPECIES: hypothetical protein [unclassified Bradyrhizobium]|nr:MULTISPECIES: hypothetical protein [unclassified Bradyrhizobium]
MLIVLVLAGLMGLLGQGARAIVGLKGMADDAKSQGVSPNDLYQAARLVTSLMIGMLVGLAAGVIYIANAGPGTSPFDWHTLLSFASAGYLGTDVLEGFISKYLAPAKPAGTPAADRPAAAMAAAAAGSQAAATPALALPSATASTRRAPSNAKQFVYAIMDELSPGTTLTDDTALADLGYDDAPSKDVIRGGIDRQHWHNVALGAWALSDCATISDIIKVVKARENV